MLGFIIGLASGTVQFLLLLKYTGSAKKGKAGIKTILFLVTQFLLPFTVLVAYAIFLGDDILLVVAGMAAVIVVGSLIRFFIVSRAGKR